MLKMTYVNYRFIQKSFDLSLFRKSVQSDTITTSWFNHKPSTT